MQSDLIRSELSRDLGISVVALDCIAGGRNSRIYKIRMADSREYAAKYYFCGKADQRDRLSVEFGSLRFLWGNGIRCIPEPILADGSRNYAVYEYVLGERIPSPGVTASDIDHAVEFLGTLRELVSRDGSESIPSASEAFFSVRGVVLNIEQRLQRLLSIKSHGVLTRELETFLKREFVPIFEDVREGLKVRLRKEAISFDEAIGRDQRTLSPSDFGFHNALRRDGEIVFLDFEYFGWDDPAKTISDFLLHPAMELNADLKRRFAAGILGRLNGSGHLHTRVRLLYPLFGLKWCLILLNEFIPEDLGRRLFAFKEEVDREDLQAQQMQKARRMLERIRSEYGHFSYC
ncbi:MAG: hypothetical protein V1736_12310 [Pseudomonadota bacterium]